MLHGSDENQIDWGKLPLGNIDFELCESIIERDVLHCLDKWVADEVKVVPQWEIETIGGKFRADFLVANKSRFIIIECDGKDYHDRDRDEWRDAMILGTGKIDAVYRLRGRDIWYHRDELFFILANWEPAIFRLGLAQKLSRVASEKLVSSKCWEKGAIALHTYLDSSEFNVTLWLERRCRITTLDIGEMQFWSRLFKFAQECGGGSLDEIMEKWRNKFSEVRRFHEVD